MGFKLILEMIAISGLLVAPVLLTQPPQKPLIHSSVGAISMPIDPIYHSEGTWYHAHTFTISCVNDLIPRTKMEDLVSSVMEIRRLYARYSEKCAVSDDPVIQQTNNICNLMASDFLTTKALLNSIDNELRHLWDTESNMAGLFDLTQCESYPLNVSNHEGLDDLPTFNHHIRRRSFVLVDDRSGNKSPVLPSINSNSDAEVIPPSAGVTNQGRITETTPTPPSHIPSKTPPTIYINNVQAIHNFYNPPQAGQFHLLGGNRTSMNLKLSDRTKTIYERLTTNSHPDEETGVVKMNVLRDMHLSIVEHCRALDSPTGYMDAIKGIEFIYQGLSLEEKMEYCKSFPHVRFCSHKSRQSRSVLPEIGWVPFVGKAMKYVYGTMDKEDLVKINQAFNESAALIHAVTKNAVVFENRTLSSVIIINDELNRLRLSFNQSHHVLAASIANISNYINSSMVTVGDKISVVQYHGMATLLMLQAQHIRSLLTSVYSILRLHAELCDHLILAKVNNLVPTRVLDYEDMSFIVHKVITPHMHDGFKIIPHGDLATLFRVSRFICSTMKRTVTYTILIPLIRADQQFDTWSFQSLPLSVGTAWFQLSIKIGGYSVSRDQLFWREYTTEQLAMCQMNPLNLCPFSTPTHAVSQGNCVIELYRADPGLETHCPLTMIESKQTSNLHILSVSNNAWIVSSVSTGIPSVLRCTKVPENITTEVMRDFTGLQYVVLPPSCTLHLPNTVLRTALTFVSTSHHDIQLNTFLVPNITKLYPFTEFLPKKDLHNESINIDNLLAFKLQTGDSRSLTVSIKELADSMQEARNISHRASIWRNYVSKKINADSNESWWARSWQFVIDEAFGTFSVTWLIIISIIVIVGYYKLKPSPVPRLISAIPLIEKSARGTYAHPVPTGTLNASVIIQGYPKTTPDVDHVVTYTNSTPTSKSLEQLIQLPSLTPGWAFVIDMSCSIIIVVMLLIIGYWLARSIERWVKSLRYELGYIPRNLSTTHYYGENKLIMTWVMEFSQSMPSFWSRSMRIPSPVTSLVSFQVATIPGGINDWIVTQEAPLSQYILDRYVLKRSKKFSMRVKWEGVLCVREKAQSTKTACKMLPQVISLYWDDILPQVQDIGMISWDKCSVIAITSMVIQSLEGSRTIYRSSKSHEGSLIHVNSQF